MGKPVVGLDCDDLLLDFIGSFLTWHNENYGTNVHISHQQEYFFEKPLGISTQESRARVRKFGGTAGYRTLPTLPGADTLVNGLSEHAKLVVITARDEGTKKATLQNLEERFPGRISKVVHVPMWETKRKYASKAVACADLGIPLLIDDNYDNVITCERHTPRVRGILYRQPWNKDIVCDLVERAHTHQQALDHALRILGVHEEGLKSPRKIYAGAR